MLKEYDFSNARKNPYASMLKKPMTIRLDEESVNYFKSISEKRLAFLIKVLSIFICVIARLRIRN